jgi:ABC-2 type transport system permease protein
MVRLMLVGVSLSLRRHLTFRANLFFDVALALAGSLSTLATVLIVFTATGTLGGWTRAETLVLVGTFEVVSGLRAAFVDPNLGALPGSIRDGDLDHQLLSPAPTLLLATLGTTAPVAAVQIPLGLAVLTFGAAEVPGPPAPGAWILLVAAATVVMWAVGTLLATVAFWAPRLSLQVLFATVWQLARYPADLYARPVRVILTSVVPLALVATVPAAALNRQSDPRAVLPPLAAAAVLALTAAVVWRRGLRRYTGAGG